MLHFRNGLRFFVCFLTPVITPNQLYASGLCFVTWGTRMSFKDSCIQQGIASGKVSHILARKSDAGPQLQLPAKSTQPRKKKKDL